jgi:cytochrome c oxidase cbb3-type subunit 1
MPFYIIRFVGGLMYLSGTAIMAWNVWKTVQAGRAQNARIPAALAHV